MLASLILAHCLRIFTLSFCTWPCSNHPKLVELAQKQHCSCPPNTFYSKRSLCQTFQLYSFTLLLVQLRAFNLKEVEIKLAVFEWHANFKKLAIHSLLDYNDYFMGNTTFIQPKFELGQTGFDPIGIGNVRSNITLFVYSIQWFPNLSRLAPPWFPGRFLGSPPPHPPYPHTHMPTDNFLFLFW